MTLSSFIHQKSYEKIEYQIRKHPVVLFPPAILFVALLLVPVGFHLLINAVWPEIINNTLTFPVMILLGSIYYLSVALLFFTYFVTFYLDLLIITNDRLLHIEQNGLFSRTISELDLNNIQDVTSEVDGFFASMFNYGTLHIQTAGAIEKFIIRQIPQPEDLRQHILALAEEDRKHHTHPKPPTP